MKKTILTFLICWITSTSYSQMYELGFFAGGSTFIGDIGATEYIKPNRAAYGIVYKYNINPRVAFRTNFTRFNIAGDDSDSSNEFRQQRGFFFENNLYEFAAGIEYNFFEYDLSSEGKKGTPYLLLQLGVVDYETARDVRLNGETIFTRGAALTIPMGLGYKSIFFEKIAFAIEARVNYNLTDGLDFTSTNVPSLNFGGSSDDWYVFTGISIVYTFGRPACFADRR